MKCKVPSFVSDQVTVINWIDNEGETLYSGSEYSKPHFILKKKIMGHTRNTFKNNLEKTPSNSHLVCLISPKY